MSADWTRRITFAVPLGNVRILQVLAPAVQTAVAAIELGGQIRDALSIGNGNGSIQGRARRTMDRVAIYHLCRPYRLHEIKALVAFVSGHSSRFGGGPSP